jgi:hypothetical protein
VAKASEPLVVESFKLDITPESVTLDGGGKTAVVKRIPATRKAVSVQYQADGETGGTAVIKATSSNMVAIREAVAAYMKRPQYVAYVTMEKDGKPLACATECKIEEPEDLSEVRKVIADVNKLGDTLQSSEEVDVSWRDRGGYLDVHVVADYDDGKGQRAHIDAVEVMKVNQRSTIYLDGQTHIRLLLKIEPSKD